MKLKRIGVVVLTLLTLVGGVNGCMINNTEKELVSYLEENYNEKFVVESFKERSVIESKYGGDEAQLHVDGNENIVFKAGTGESSSGGYYDNYLLAKWGNDLKGEFQKVVDENIESRFDYSIALRSGGNTYSEEAKKMSAKEYLEHDKEEISLILQIAIEVDEKQDVSKYYEGLYNILQNIKLYDTDRYSIVVGFVNNIDNDEVKEYLRVASGVDEVWSQMQCEAVLGEIVASSFSKVNSKEDFAKYYSKIGE